MRVPLSIRALWFLLLPGLVALPGTANGAFRCGSSLVDVGDWPVEVEERCGAPDYVATYPTATIPGVGVVGEVEHWYYNPGPQGFIRRLEFRDGKLHREHSLGYGFAGDSAGDCSPARLQDGVSEFEMVAYCGEPVSRRVTWKLSATDPGLSVTTGPVPWCPWKSGCMKPARASSDVSSDCVTAVSLRWKPEKSPDNACGSSIYSMMISGMSCPAASFCAEPASVSISRVIRAAISR